MSYDFSFDKKSALLIVGGCVGIGVLLFFAGFIVGWDRSADQGKLQLEKGSAAGTVSTTPSSQVAENKTASKESTKPSPDSGTGMPVSSQVGKPSAAPSPQAASQTTSNKKEDAVASSDAGAFSLQFGAFQNQDNAARLKMILKTKGYSVFVYDTLDAGGHVWHAVRMGHFPDMKEASAAAEVFAKKEKIPVSVRPGNEL